MFMHALLFRAAKTFLSYGMCKPIHFLKGMQVSTR